jgi:transcriptional regulator with XRE-family HTH domain
MTGYQLGKYRKERKRTQLQTAHALKVSQAYLSLLEAGKRPLTADLQRRAAIFFELPPTKVPVRLELPELRSVSDASLASDLATLGYKGFSHFKKSRLKNPAVVLLSALNSPKRDARLVEALPWVVFAFPDMEWREVVKTAKVYDLQNRLGFVTNVARRVAEFRNEGEKAAKLKQHEAELERSLLAREETLCNETMTNAERRWLAGNRPEEARRWHLLTDLSPENVNYYV